MASPLIEIGIIYTQVLLRKDLSNDTQIRVIGSTEPGMHMKMLKNLSEKCRAKFPAMTLTYSMIKIACLNDAFSKIFKLEASPVEGQSLAQKDKKRRKRKAEKTKTKT